MPQLDRNPIKNLEGRKHQFRARRHRNYWTLYELATEMNKRRDERLVGISSHVRTRHGRVVGRCRKTGQRRRSLATWYRSEWISTLVNKRQAAAAEGSVFSMFFLLELIPDCRWLFEMACGSQWWKRQWRLRFGERDCNNRTNDFTALKLYPLQLVRVSVLAPTYRRISSCMWPLA